MSSKHQKIAIACLLCVAGISLAAVVAQEVGDPWAVKYKQIAPEQIAEEVRLGALAQLPLVEFEDLLKKARLSTPKQKQSPIMVRSAYSAELIDNGLVGSGEWSIHNPTQGPALLPLPTLNFAMSQVRHIHDQSQAILGDMDGKNLGLLLLRPGSQSISFHWSARGVLSPEGLHFDLRLPACPVASLKLELARDLVVSVRRSAALVSDVKSEEGGKRTWLLNLTGKPQVELDIRPLAGTGALAQPLIAQVEALQEITPDKVNADFKFQIDIPRHPVRELIFDCDPRLTPYEVSLPVEPKGGGHKNAEILQWHMGDNQGNPTNLVVELREPFQGTLSGLQIRCLSPRSAEMIWTSPYLRLRQALTRGENLKLLVQPDVPLQKWDPGSFRVLSSDNSVDGALLPDGMLMLTLEDPRTIDVRTNFQQRRPSFVGKSQGTDLHTRQQTWWHVGPQSMTLESEIAFETARGSLFQLQVRLPKTPKNGKAWRVDKVTPSEIVQAYSIVDQPIKGKEPITEKILSVDLRGAVTPRNPAKIRVELSSVRDNPGRPGENLLDFPDLEPFHAAVRNGTFHINVDPIYQASVVKHSVPAVTADGDSPAGTPPLFSFQFREQALTPQSIQPSVTGKLRLLPSSDRSQAFTRTKVLLAAGRASVQTRLELEPLMGSLDQCDFIVAQGGSTPWQAHFEKASGRTVKLQRLPLEEQLPYLLGLGDPSPYAWLPLAYAVDDMQVWRMRFAPALTRRETVLLEAPCTKLAENWWNVPLISVLDTPRRQGEVLLEPSGTVLGQVLAHGLELPAGKDKKSLEMRRLPVSEGVLPMLRLQASPAETARSRQEHIDHARLQSYLFEDGRVFHHFSFQAANWTGKDISVTLPGAVRVLGAKVAGFWQNDVLINKAGANVEVRLPVPSAASFALRDKEPAERDPQDTGTRWQMDIYYSSDPEASNWSSWVHHEAPWPTLPVAPLTRQRTWFLAPGLVPLRQDLWRDPLVPLGLASPGQNLIRKAWRLGDPLLDYFSTRPNDNRQLREALGDLHKKWSSTFTLGEALEQLAFEHLKDRAFIVVDSAGLAAVELGPDTRVGKLTLQPDQPFWEGIGLATISCPSGIVLTTRQQLQSWKGALSPRDLDPAVLEALTAGRDRQGQLQTVSEWVRGSGQESGIRSQEPGGKGKKMDGLTPETAAAYPAGLFDGPPPLGWTVWQPRGSQADVPEFDVAHSADLRNATYVLFLATLLLTWKMRWTLSTQVFFRVLLLWSTAWGLAFFWLPTSLQTVALGPLLAAWGFALLVYIMVLGRAVPRLARRGLTTHARARGHGSNVSRIGLLLLLTLCLPLGSAQPPPGGKSDPQLVRVVQGPDKAIALVSPAFLQRLKDKVAAPPQAQTSAALIDAQYTAEVKGNVVVVHAQFDIFCPGAKSELVLPLTGVVLNEGGTLRQLDSAAGTGLLPPASSPAYLVPLLDGGKGDRGEGFVVPITGKGLHRLDLSFVSSWKNAADFQELRFGIPRLPQSRLKLALPGSWRDVQLPLCQGNDQSHTTARGQHEIQADLGRENEIQVRWRQDAASTAPAANLEVRELYLWDLRPANFAVTGLLNYTVTKGAVNQLRLLIPDNLEIQSIELGSLSAAEARISKWRLDPARQLSIDLANPVSGKLQIILNLAPRLALDAPSVQLRLPSHVNLTKQQDGALTLLAYRLEGWKSTDKGPGIADAGDRFAREWKEAGQRDPGPFTRAYSFRRTPGQQWQLQVFLQPIRPSIRQETVCQVHPVYTDVVVRIQAQGSKDVPVTFLQCEVPAAMILAGVTGHGIHHWCRSDGIVQIWYSNPVVEANVVLSGWVKNVLPQEGDKPGRFVLPRIRQVPPQSASMTLKIESATGCLIEPETFGPVWTRAGGLVDLQESTADKDAARPARQNTLTYKASGPNYSGTFQIRPPAPGISPEVRMLTTVGLGNGIFSFSTRVDCQILREVPPGTSKLAKQEGEIVMTLRNWPADVRLDPLPSQVRSVYRRTGNDHAWTITLPEDQLWPLSVQVHGQTPLGPRQKIDVPGMDVAHADYRGRWLVWSGPDPKPQTSGLAIVKDLARLKRNWSAELGRARTDSIAWKVKDPAWQLQVEAAAAAAPLAWSILWAEHEIHHEEGRWLHQASYLISTRTAAELTVLLPESARFQAASWGEQFINPRLDDARRLSLQLPQSPSGQVLRLRWFYPGEDPLQPKREVPIFTQSAAPLPQGEQGGNDTADVLATTTTLWLPADLTAPVVAPKATSLASELLLNRARAQMILSSLLAEHAPEQKTKIEAAQVLFHELTRHAEFELTALSRVLPEMDLSVPRARLQDLRRQNKERAGKGKYEPARLKAETGGVADPMHAPGALALPQDGAPLHGFGPARSPLLPAGQSGVSTAVLSSQLLLLGSFALFFLSFLSRFFRALPALWPEQLMVFGLLGTLLLGFSLLGAALLAAGLLGRSIWMVLWLWRLAIHLFQGTAVTAPTI
jgi:hypothetical protein